MNVNAFEKSISKEKQRKMMTRTQKRLLFYVLIVALPVAQFCIFYIYVNFNSIIMAFQKYEANANSLGYTISFAGLDNFTQAFGQLKQSGYMIVNSLKLYAVNLFIVLPLSLVFSFYLYKKFAFSGIFQVILFLPQILSSVVIGLLFKYVVSDFYIAFMQKVVGKEVLSLIVDPKTSLGTVLFYNAWVGFGVNVLMFHGAMNGINESIIESAHLDGANILREFWNIVFPMIFPTFITFVIVGMAGVFTNQMHLYTLFGGGGTNLSTLGYYLYVSAQQSDVVGSAYRLSYPALASFGLILTIIIFPITLVTRKLLQKLGPSA